MKPSSRRGAGGERRRPANVKRGMDEILEAHESSCEADRDLADPTRLHELLVLVEGLAAWAAQFADQPLAILVAAAAIGQRGVEDFVSHIDDRLAALAPIRSTRPTSHGTGSGGSAATRDRSAGPRRDLSRTLNYFRFISEHLAGTRSFTPDYDYPCDPLPDHVPWADSYEPPDEEVTRLVELLPFLRGGDRARDGEQLERRQRFHDRVGQFSRGVLRDFKGYMDSEDAVGFSRVRAALRDRPSARARAACRRFELLTHKLNELFVDADRSVLAFGRPHQAFFAVGVIQKFLAAGREYAELCLAKLPVTTSHRQMLRKALLRRIGIVGQYAFLVDGNSKASWFREIVDLIDHFAVAARTDLLRLLSGHGGGAAKAFDTREVVHDLNNRIIDPRVFVSWQKTLGSESNRIGAIVSAVAMENGPQATPWSPGQKVPALRRNGLLTRQARKRDVHSEELREWLFKMQLVGLAFQAPWDFLTGETSEGPTRGSDHGNLRWLVSPFGAVLATTRARRGTVAVSRRLRPVQTPRRRRQPRKIPVKKPGSQRGKRVPGRDRRR